MAQVLKFSAKVGIAVGTGYVLGTTGVFSSQDKAISSFKRLESRTRDYVPEDYVRYVPKVPSSVMVRDKWNSGVQSVFRSIEAAPDAGVDLASSAVSKSKDFIQKQLKS